MKFHFHKGEEGKPGARGHWVAALVAVTLAAPGDGKAAEPEVPTLRTAYEPHFLVGVALGGSHVTGRNDKAAAIVARQFSSITAENDMKWQSIHPEPGVYRFERADAYFDFAAKHGMKVIGHTLVWHSQTPDWVFRGNGGEAKSRSELLDLMREHIHKVVGRYKGRAHGWDVVNEALSDGGPDMLRDSPWRRIIGDDFIDHAFRFAREADPGVELYYNDYGLEDPRKRANAVRLVKGMLERGVPVDGIGTQSHFHLDAPGLEEVEKTIKEFAALRVKVMVTELDVDVLPTRGHGGADISRRERGGDGMDPYKDGLPAEVQERLARRYADLFRIYLRHRESITRVTFWGLDDGATWLNHFPIEGRTNHPLLIDRKLEPKPAFFSVLALPREIEGP